VISKKEIEPISTLNHKSKFALGMKPNESRIFKFPASSLFRHLRIQSRL
jgi:hypothetical protein